MCLWKLFWFIHMFIQYDRRGRSSRTGRRDMKDKRDERYERDKRYKAKRASIWTFESQSWLSNIVFKLRIFENKTIFFFTLKLQGAGVIALLTCGYDKSHPLTLFALGSLNIKAPPINDLLIHVSYLQDIKIETRSFFCLGKPGGVKISQSILMSVRFDHMVGRHGLAKYVNRISQIWLVAPDFFCKSLGLFFLLLIRLKSVKNFAVRCWSLNKISNFRTPHKKGLSLKRNFWTKVHTREQLLGRRWT